MTGLAKRVREKKRLSFGAAAAEVVLDDENFHCRLISGAESGGL